jgi:hypothetical protein
MPEYSCYYDGQEPVLPQRYIDDMKNLTVGDYLFYHRSFEMGGRTKIYNITKITKNCVYIEYYGSGGEYKPLRLKWKDIDRRFQDVCLHKGYLDNKSYDTTFYFYVKKDEMNLEGFTQTDKLLRGCA